MRNINSDAEKKLFHEISVVVDGTELAEMSRLPLCYTDLNNTQRFLRLSEALAEFWLELDNNLILLDFEKKLQLINRHLKNATEYKDHYNKEYGHFKINKPKYAPTEAIAMQNLQTINIILAELENRKNDVIINNNIYTHRNSPNTGNTLMLEAIFSEKNNAFEVCKGLLDYFDIIINGVPHVTPGRQGKLAGLMIAIKTTPGMLKLDKITDSKLLDYFNSYLNTNYSKINKKSKDYITSFEDAKHYINLHIKKK